MTLIIKLSLDALISVCNIIFSWKIIAFIHFQRCIYVLSIQMPKVNYLCENALIHGSLRHFNVLISFFSQIIKNSFYAAIFLKAIGWLLTRNIVQFPFCFVWNIREEINLFALHEWVNCFSNNEMKGETAYVVVVWTKAKILTHCQGRSSSNPQIMKLSAKLQDFV